MRNAIKLIAGLCVFGFFNPAYSADDPQTAKSTQAAFEVLKSCKNLGDLLKKIDGKLDPHIVASLQKRFKPAEKTTFRVQMIAKNKLMIDTPAQSVTVEFLGNVEASSTRTAFRINGKEFELNQQLSPDDNLRELIKLLPKHVSLMDLIFPQAYADVDMSSLLEGAMLGVAGALLITAILDNDQYNCRSPWGQSYDCRYGYQQPWAQPQMYAQPPYYGGYHPAVGAYGGGVPYYAAPAVLPVMSGAAPNVIRAPATPTAVTQ